MAAEDDFSFEDFCRKYQISDVTRETLRKEDIDSIAVLEEISLDELKSLEFSIGQRLLVVKGVKAVQAAAAKRKETEKLASLADEQIVQKFLSAVDQVDALPTSVKTPHHKANGFDSGRHQHFREDQLESDRLLVKRPLQDELNNNVVPQQMKNDEKSEAPVNISKAVSVKWKVNKNIFITSIAYLLLFQSFIGLSIIQSTVHGALGTVGLGILFGASAAACITISSIMTTALGCKKSMLVSFVMFLTWMVANFHVEMYTIVPTALISGMANGPLWTAQATYFTMLGLQYSEVTGEREDAVIARFFGLFFCFLLFGTSMGCGITSLILSSSIGDPPADVSVVSNVTAPSWPVGVLPQCGAGYCPGVIQDMLMSITPVYNGTNSNSTVEGVDDSAAAGAYIKLLVLVGTHVTSTVLAIVLLLFTDDLPNPQEEKKSLLAFVKEGFKLMGTQLVRKRQLLLTPINLYAGLSQSFILAEITEAFVACTLGLEMLGYALMTWGVTSCLASIICGYLVKYTGRIPIFTFGEMVRLALILFLTFWTVDNRITWVFFLIPSLWAVGDGILMSQINALYGYMFYDNSESAFAIYRFYEGLGLLIGYIVNSMLCLLPKLYFMISIQIVGWVLYYAAEIVQRRRERKEAEESEAQVIHVTEEEVMKLSTL